MNEQKYLWIFPTLLHRWIWKDLARDLAEKTGLRPLFIIATEQDRRFWQEQFGEPLNADIAVHFDYLGYALDGGDVSESDEALADRAVAYEQRHGITLMRDMVLGCRHIGRGFILGGQGHPESKVSQAITRRVAVQTCMAIADDFEAMARDYPPGLMLVGGGGGGVYMKSACLIARREHIPFRSLVHARFADHYLWADSELEESESFRQFLATQPAPTNADIDYVRDHLAPTGLSVIGFAAMRRESGWLAIGKRIAMTYIRHIYGRLRGYRNSRVGASPAATAAMMIRQRLDRHKLSKMATVRIADLPATAKVVYFPLQTEPEHSLNVLSPDHSNQLATAVELALNLSADTVLAVKEHPYQIGRRTAGTYETLANIPNVAFLHIDEPSIEIIKRADLVAVITSSAGYEAAALGKPVLHFGRHGQALDLPHVHAMKGFSDLGQIPNILMADNDEARSARQRDGARYFLALEKFCLDMSAFNAHGRTERPNTEELSKITDALLKTLPVEIVGQDDKKTATA